MATLEELTGAGQSQSQMAAGLSAGLTLLSASQSVVFVKYYRCVLPVDGSVFWVNAGLSSASSVLSPTGDVIGNSSIIEAKGSLHVSRRKVNDGTETYSINRVVFTTDQNLGQDFNKINPNTIFIGTIGSQKFAFSDQGNFFQQANLYHYAGDAVYPQMRSQLIEQNDDFCAIDPVISNSLPIWLGLNIYTPPYSGGFSINPALTLYPSFLVPDNIQPPYGVVHIAEDATEALGAVPFLDSGLSSWQLAKDRVRITLYGCTNADAISFLNFVMQYSEDTSAIGLMNIPIVRDAKLKQAELAVLAQKKTIDFDVSYQQTTARAISRQMIAKLVNTYNNLPYTWQNA